MVLTKTAFANPAFPGVEDIIVPLMPDVNVEEPMDDGIVIICTGPVALLTDGRTVIGTTFPKFGLVAAPESPPTDVTLLLELGPTIILAKQVVAVIELVVTVGVIFEVLCGDPTC